ncbi:hypothetical protein B0H34DRAFT_413914 [Crassisporium funariophilum]|nr:hypothetical protein B0H34DRAFT_413914 [Crassisporium funariophilum]
MFMWLKWGSTALEGLNKDDIVIVLIGPSGGGKSKFINTAAGEELLKVGIGLAPCTKEIAYAARTPTTGSARQIVLVDTPAFPDPDTTDFKSVKQVENMIKDWLQKAFADKTVKVAGFLYIYKITDNRMTQPPRPHVEMIKNLCGVDSKAILVTTMWEHVTQATGISRQKELAAKWLEGSRIACHDGTQESAWKVISQLLGYDVQP